MDGIKAFEYVLAIAETGSVSEAAEKIGIAQSALSRYILNLEKNLGLELFDRTVLPIALTEAGRAYVETGRQIIRLNRRLEKRLEDVKNHRNRVIRIGTGPSRAPAIMPRILSSFSAECPGVRVVTDECRTSELAERLETGKLDLIITFLDHQTEGFGMEDLFEEKVELAVPSEFKRDVQESLEDGAVDVSKLHVPFISLQEGQQLRNAFDILARGAVKPIYTSAYQESAMALVKHGLGVALTPSYWKLIDGSDVLAYYPLKLPADMGREEKTRLMAVINRRVGIFYRKEQFLTEAEKAYIAAAKKVCEELR